MIQDRLFQIKVVHLKAFVIARADVSIAASLIPCRYNVSLRGGYIITTSLSLNTSILDLKLSPQKNGFLPQ